MKEKQRKLTGNSSQGIVYPKGLRLFSVQPSDPYFNYCLKAVTNFVRYLPRTVSL